MSEPEVTSGAGATGRARVLLKVPRIWAGPVLISSVLMFLISLIYLGSIVNPTSHLHHLPVSIVDEDSGATVDGAHLNLGQDVASALKGSASVSRLLSLQPETLSDAQDQMSLGKLYGAVVIPSDFTRAALVATKPSTPVEDPRSGPTIELLTNPRLGGVGASLAGGVMGAAVPEVSSQLAQKVLAVAHLRAPSSEAARSELASFITLSTTTYRPLPANAGLGLSAFYIALLVIMCGFLASTIVNNFVDSALGYGATEIGPRWRQRRPIAISRVQTLLTKWSMGVALAPVLTGLLLLAGVGILHADAPHLLLLWAYASFAAAVVAVGTLFFFAWLGTLGQLVAMLVFIYLSLASSGGTVPLQAVPGFYRFVSNFEPLRQILGGVRAILYFNAQAGAGLAHAWLTTGIGLVIFLTLGFVITVWYDKRGLARIQPDLLAHINVVVDEYLRKARLREGPAADAAAPAAADVNDKT